MYGFHDSDGVLGGSECPVGLSFISRQLHFNMAIVTKFLLLFRCGTKGKERIGKSCFIHSSIMIISSLLVFYI